MKKKKVNIKLILIILVVIILITGGVILTIYLVDKNNREDLRNKAADIVKKLEKEFDGTNYAEFENGIAELNNDGKVTYLKISDGDYCYTKVDDKDSVIKEKCEIEKITIIASDNECLKDKCEVGTELEINVNPDVKYIFNVLKDEEGYLTLMMRDTIGYKSSYDEALKYLNEITNDWIYINAMDYTYKNTGKLYTNLTIEKGNLKVDETVVDGVTRARLITREELKTLGCSEKIGSCPEWLYSSLSESNTNKNPYGVWTITTSNTFGDYIFTLFYTGSININVSSNDSSYGIRPIIVIKK